MTHPTPALVLKPHASGGYVVAPWEHPRETPRDAVSPLDTPIDAGNDVAVATATAPAAIIPAASFPQPPDRPGVGAEFKRLLKDRGVILPGHCDCNALMQELTDRGPEGVARDAATYVSRLEAGRAGWGWGDVEDSMGDLLARAIAAEKSRIAPRPRTYRVIGAMRITDVFKEHLPIALDPFVAFCDEVVFLRHNAKDPQTIAALARAKNNVCVAKWRGDWDHGAQLALAYRLANCFAREGDWIAIPDQDEILPYDALHDEIAAAERAGSTVISFPFANCWGDPETIIHPDLNSTGDHGKLYRAGIGNFVENGFCLPASEMQRVHSCPLPLRHCHMMTQALRDGRVAAGRGLEPWVGSPRTIRFRAGMTLSSAKQSES